MPTRLTIFGVRLPERTFRRPVMLPAAAALIALLAYLEWSLKADFTLGILYVLPIVIAATVLNRIEILLLAIVCAYIRGQFNVQATALDNALRFLMATIAYTGVGLLIVEMSRNRRAVIAYYATLKLEQDLRRQAEEQLRILAESSPAGILTVGHDGLVIAANRSAFEMFGVQDGQALVGEPVGRFVSALANALKVPSGPRQMRASAWAWARKADGTVFPIAAWFSTYGHGPDRHLAAIVVDVSEEVRDRERENFRHLLDYNRLLAGAVSHEIRNLCSAASVVCSVLARRPELQGSPDFAALSQLVDGLSRMASFEFAASSGGQATRHFPRQRAGSTPIDREAGLERSRGDGSRRSSGKSTGGTRRRSCAAPNFVEPGSELSARLSGVAGTGVDGTGDSRQRSRRRESDRYGHRSRRSHSAVPRVPAGFRRNRTGAVHFANARPKLPRRRPLCAPTGRLPIRCHT